MKQLLLILAVWCAGWLHAQNYQLVPSKSSLAWTGHSEAGGFVQQGTINPKSGTLNLEQETITSAQVVVDMRSISNPDKELTKHLKNDDFFDVKKYPEAKLVVRSVSGGIAQVDLTIKSITKSLEIPVSKNLKNNTLSVSGKASIDRTIFGIKYNSSSFFQDLGSYAIKNEFDLKFALVFEPVGN